MPPKGCPGRVMAHLGPGQGSGESLQGQRTGPREPGTWSGMVLILAGTDQVPVTLPSHRGVIRTTILLRWDTGSEKAAFISYLITHTFMQHILSTSLPRLPRSGAGPDGDTAGNEPDGVPVFRSSLAIGGDT